MSYVIRYDLEPRSYHLKAARVGPMFGGTLEEAARFETRRAAADVQFSWPLVAVACSTVIEVEVEVVDADFDAG